MTFYGWRVVGAAFVVLFTAYGAQYSFGIFFAALLDEFGWSRAGLAGVFSLYAFAYSVFGFPAGRLTDRWGPRRVITAGGVFLGGALASMALVRHLWQPYVIYGVVAALGMGTAYVPCSSTIVKWFARRRGLAVGLASAGGSVGNFVIPPLAYALVGAAGWRGAYVIFGAAVIVVLVLAAVVMRRDPESMGLHPDGDAAPWAPAHALEGWGMSRAVRSGPFWILAAAFTATWVPVFIPLVHLVPLSRDLGHAPAVGPWLVSALGAGAVAGRLIMGGVSDGIGRRTTIVIGMAVQALAFVAFASARDVRGVALTALAFGYAYGTTSTMFPAIVSDFFGRQHAGSLVGLLFMLAGSMAAWGPIIAGAAYDATGSYAPAFYLAAGANLLGAALLTVARAPDRRAPCKPF